MIYKAVNLPLFFRIGKGTIKSIGKILEEEGFFFKKVLLLTGNYGQKVIAENCINEQFYNASVIDIRNIKPCIDTAYLKSFIINQEIELIIAIGGGRINDLGKYLSMKTSIPLVTIPTALSNDGLASPISVIKINGKHTSIGTTSPIGVIGDLELLIQSPDILLLSGIGDLMSNLSATLDWELANRETGEKIDMIARNMSHNSAITILYNFKRGIYKSLKDEKLIEDLFNSLIMSAISMILAKSSRPASGSEHNISHALDALNSRKPHGIQVGFATLFTLFLHNEKSLLNDILAFYKHVKFQITFPNLGITEEKFLEALRLAPTLRNRYTILNKLSQADIVEKFYEFKKYISSISKSY